MPDISGHEAPEPSARAVAETSTQAKLVEVAVPDLGARLPATNDPAPTHAPGLVQVHPSPFQLVGTSVSATDTFAVLKETDQSMLTVHEGDSVGGYIIAAIAPDRVKVRSPDNSEQLLMLVAATGNSITRATPTTNPAPETVTDTASVVETINTDQSIPEDVTFGPTGSLPESVHQMGH